MKKILTIAGSDCSGGAGIQADIKTITAHKMYAMSAITALTAQNTTGVYGVVETTPEFVKQQLETIFEDITPDAVKIGMVSNIHIIKVIAETLTKYRVKNIVVDPVMVATSGSKLLSHGAEEELVNSLFPLATVITPNIPEAEKLCGFNIENYKDMEKAAKIISKVLEGGILIKGGHSVEDANDLLYYNDEIVWIKGKRIDNNNTHGTGCTLSSSIACNLAEGKNLRESIESAKKYISIALEAKLDIGKGNGPLNHCVI